MSKISIVIPVLDEAESVQTLFAEIESVCDDNGFDFEIIFVDDGSTDHTWDVVSKLATEHKRLIAVRFRKNFGKAAALRAGIEQSIGSTIVTMDGDLQDDPAEIPKLIGLLGDKFDCVSGWKKDRKDPLGKRLPSKVFNSLASWLTGVKLRDHNCGFKAYRREIFDEVQLYGERHRFIPILASARGFRVGEVAVNHRPRQYGVSKYGWSRLPKGLVDLLTVSFMTGFNQRPQHVIGTAGLFSFAIGSIGMFWMAIYWVLRMTLFGEWEPVHRRPLVLYSAAAMLLGAQLLCMGFLAELIIAKGQNQEQPFSVSDRVPENRPVAGSVGPQANDEDESNQTKVV